MMIAGAAPCQTGGQLRFCLRAEPKTFNPILVDDQYSETVRYLTGGVLIRVNRHTQQVQPELALQASVQQGGRRIVFRLRRGVLFSDGTPFTAEDVHRTLGMAEDMLRGRETVRPRPPRNLTIYDPNEPQGTPEPGFIPSRRSLRTRLEHWISGYQH